MACPAASVGCEPLVETEPETEKRTVIPGVAFPNASFTVAVTQCCASTVLTAVFGDSTSVAGLAGTT